MLRSSGRRIQHPTKNVLHRFLNTIINRFPLFDFIFPDQSNQTKQANHHNNQINIYYV